MENVTIKFLLDASMILRKKNNFPTCNNMVSQLRQKCLAIVAEAPNHNGSFVPCKFCKVCGNAWSEGLYAIHILGHNCKMRKHKMKNKLKFALSGSKKFRTFYEKRKDNVMVKRCLVCNSLTKCGMNKPHLKTEDDLSFDNNLNCVENKNSVKKKRKRKSMKQSFAGLSAAAVLQTRSSFSQMKKKECTSSAIKKIKIVPEKNNSIVTSSSRRDVKDNALFNKLGKSVKSYPSAIGPEIESSENHQSSLSIENFKSNLKKKKMNVHKKICIEKKPEFKKKKSFVSEFLNIL